MTERIGLYIMVVIILISTCSNADILSDIEERITEIENIINTIYAEE